MIISRTPLRISMGGGGTDLPAFYKENGGFVVGTTIQKYLYITVSNHFQKLIKLNYSRVEICKKPSQIKHPIIRESLKKLKINNHIEISSIADLPAKSGLGSSGAFSVGLINGLLSHLGKVISKNKLAEMACHIEMDLLREPVGKQDQYMAAYGGFICLSINRNGNVKVRPLKISPESKQDLENNLVYFYTGILRKASDVLLDQKKALEKKDNSLQSMLEIKKIGYKIKKCLENDNLDEFGRLMHEHWEAKKKTSQKISNNIFDKYYNIAKNNGALGGKIIGAGGGGFFMFYCDSRTSKNNLRKAFISKGLAEIRVMFEQEGSKIVLNLGGRTN